ncbi:MAG: cell wall metabolism sensor histidine kinase WalK [Planctomycetes bacterium]|nr:cell wall metabolism sensor histidine kinase WalK [Planctomycetota bacterium]
MNALSSLRSSFFWKLYGGFLALILVTAGIAAWRIDDQVERDMTQALDDATVFLEELARPAFETGATPEWQARITTLGRAVGARLTVIGLDGVVLADSDEEPERMENHGARAEVASARESGAGSDERRSATTGARTRYHARAVRSNGELVGFVRAALGVAEIDAKLAEARATVAWGAALAALIGLFIAWPLASRTTRPLAQLSDAAHAIARGDHDHPLPPEGDDELGELARSFRTMNSELERRVAALAADRNKVLAILASMVEGVVAVDGEDRVVHMNAAAARILRTDAERSFGRRVWETTRVLEVPRILEAARRSNHECRAEVKLGESNAAVFVELFASPLSGATGENVGAVVVLHDVTELRRLEGVRRDFVANVSHELKTPLTAIRGFIETVLDDEAMPRETERRFLGRIRDQAGRLTALVQDLLTLARIEAQEQRAELLELDLARSVRETAERFAPIAEQKQIRLDLELGDRPATVRADEEGLRQLVGNLLDNALKYTPATGSVGVRIVTEEEDVRLDVTDTGIGIEPRDQERIFERFYRVDKARSRELGGTGLGLAIVKHLALSYGGTISLESVPGRGSTFRVRLPLARNTVAP